MTTRQELIECIETLDSEIADACRKVADARGKPGYGERVAWLEQLIAKMKNLRAKFDAWKNEKQEKPE
jgi:uncharacterized membrane protein YccC